MFIGKVKGSVVSNQKDARIGETKLLLVEAYNASKPGEKEMVPTGKMLVVVDSLGAGAGEMVLVTQGSSARLTDWTKTMPVDAVVIGIIDKVN